MFSSPTTNQPNDQAMQRCGAWAMFGMALCYLFMFMVFGALLSFPQTGAVADTIAYIVSQKALLTLTNGVGYLLFGCLLLIGVQALHHRLKQQPSHVLNTASLFGVIWVVLMMCTGMIAIIGLNTLANLAAGESPHTQAFFYTYSMLVDALGGGIELVGGSWVLLLSICALRQQQQSKSVHWLGVVVGLFGVLTVFQSVPEFKDAFGLSQIVWFIWMGFTLWPRDSHALQQSLARP